MLTIKDLQITAQGKLIVNGIDLDLAAGEVLALMGPNGSGKTTLAMFLAGHPSYEKKAGAVKFLGKNLAELSPDERAQAGVFLAFQQPIEVPGVRVWQFLRRAYQARFSKKKQQLKSALEFREHLEKLAAELGLKPELVRRGLNDGFSGGEKKRLELLQMLVLQPKLVILDETDSGLDVDALKLVGKVVKKMIKNGAAVLVITHYARILQYLPIDQVAVMIKGKIVELGKAKLIEQIDKRGYASYNSYSKK